MSLDWFEKFINLYLAGNDQVATKLKYANIPSKVYKFQSFEENRIPTVLNEELWFSLPKEMNDPFDSKGLWWKQQEIDDLLEKLYSEGENTQDNFCVDDLISKIRDNIRISCFSEKLYNMPMWAHYASNHAGFCIEYDFTNLDYNNDFVKYLFPIKYLESRYDITNILTRSIEKHVNEGKIDSRVILLAFLMITKHDSWSYEKEWRIVDFNNKPSKPFKSGLLKCPIKPTAIYLGMNFDYNEIDDVKNKFRKIDIPVYKLKSSNSEFFDLDLQKL